MVKLYLIDQENVSFQPETAEEAIILFNRLRRKDLIRWDYVPELLQKLARNLDGPNHDTFCQWIVNPTCVTPGKPGYFADLCRQDQAPLVRQQPDSEDDEKTEPPAPLEPPCCSPPLDMCESSGPTSVGPDTPSCNGSDNEISSTVPEPGTPTKPETL